MNPYSFIICPTQTYMSKSNFELQNDQTCNTVSAASTGVVLSCRGVSDWWRGSSILMKERGQWVELAGHDYVMDLIADLELPPDFPKQKSYFVISTDDPARVRANASLSVHKTHTNTHARAKK